MNLSLRSRKQAGVAPAVVFLIVLILVTIILLGVVAIIMVKAIKRIVPRPPPDPDGWVPGIGNWYDGGVVIGTTTTPPGPQRAETLAGTLSPGNATVWIFAGDTPAVPMTAATLVWSDSWDSFTNTLLATNSAGTVSNLFQLETFTNGIPDHRFYSIVVSNN